MERDQVLGVVLLALAGGVAYDIWFGAQLAWRKALHVVLVILMVAVVLLIPAGASDGPSDPLAEPPPYRF